MVLSVASFFAFALLYNGFVTAEWTWTNVKDTPVFVAQKAMIDLADSDLFFYIGLGLEGFVEKAKTSLKDQNVKFIATAENVPEEDLHISTGHTHDEHEHEEEEHDDHQDSEHDSHVWLSPVISEQLATVIKDELINVMPEQEQLFTQNYETIYVNIFICKKNNFIFG